MSVAAPTAQNDVPEHANEITLDLSGNSYQAAWPIGLITPSLRSNKYFPLRNMGEMVLQYTLANASEALWAADGNGTPTYQLSDIYLEADIVKCCDCAA